jgi:hypothetical protein
VRFEGTEEFRFESGSPPVHHFAGNTPKTKKVLPRQLLDEDILLQLTARGLSAADIDGADPDERRAMLTKAWCKELRVQLATLGFGGPAVDAADFSELKKMLRLADWLSARARLVPLAGGGGTAAAAVSPVAAATPAAAAGPAAGSLSLGELLLQRKDEAGLVDKEGDYAHGRRRLTVDQFLEPMDTAELIALAATLGGGETPADPERRGGLPAAPIVVPPAPDPASLPEPPPEALLPLHAAGGLAGGRALANMIVAELAEEARARGLADSPLLPPGRTKFRLRAPWLELLHPVLAAESRLRASLGVRLHCLEVPCLAARLLPLLPLLPHSCRVTHPSCTAAVPPPPHPTALAPAPRPSARPPVHPRPLRRSGPRSSACCRASASGGWRGTCCACCAPRPWPAAWTSAACAAAARVPPRTSCLQSW